MVAYAVLHMQDRYINIDVLFASVHRKSASAGRDKLKQETARAPATASEGPQTKLAKMLSTCGLEFVGSARPCTFHRLELAMEWMEELNKRRRVIMHNGGGMRIGMG